MSTAAPLQNTAAKSRQFSNSSNAALLLQRKCACGGSARLVGQCDKCQTKKLIGLQTKLAVGEPGDVYEQEADRVANQVLATQIYPGVSGAPPHIQRFSGQSNGQMHAAPASVDQVLASPGRPLEPALRQDMEQRFGHDFSRVRVHSGAAAEQSAQDMNANAYTVGQNIVFGAGRFAPGMQEGRRLIAHELTHVVQQSGVDGIRDGQGGENRGLSLITLSAATVQRAPRAAAEVTAQDEPERIRLALRAARLEVQLAIDTFDTEPSETFSDNLRRGLFQDHVKETVEHLDVAGLNIIGRTDHKAYAAEAAAVLEPLAELLQLTPGMSVAAEEKALQAYSGRLASWAGTTKAAARPKGFDKKDEELAMILALRSVRQSCDDALAGDRDPFRVEIAGIMARQDIVYAHNRLNGEKRERHAPDVDVATRSLGRLIAWVKYANVDGSGQPRVPLPGQWVSDVTKTGARMRGIVGLSPDGWISDVVDGDIISPDPNRPDKAAGQNALNRWNESSLTTIEAVRRWITNNWIAFISATSKNPRLSWDIGIFDQTASNLVGNLLTTLGEGLIKKGSAALAGALIGSIAGPVGAAIGFVIGLLVETVASIAYDYIFGDKGKKEDQAARDASQRTGKMALAKHEEFSVAADAARREQKKAFDVVQNNLNAASSKRKVNAITEGLNKDKPAVEGPKNPDDRSLYRAMLRDWVLENAGDEEDANKETSELQWEDALKESFGKGTDQLKGRRDLFAYRTRGEWTKAGFNPAEVRRLTGAMIETANRPHADEMYVYDGKVFPLPGVTSTGELRNYLHKHGHNVMEEDMVAVERDTKNMKGTCELDLKKSDGTTYVNEWSYVLEFLSRPAHYRTLKAKFDVEPD